MPPDLPSDALVDDEPDEDGRVLEDDGVLPAADSLDGEPTDDVLDTGVDAGDRYRASTGFGTTLAEEQRGESLDELLAEEEPDEPSERPWTDEEYGPDDEDVPFARSGRLIAPDEGSLPDRDPDLYARDVGVDGGGASAEEAAVHLTFDPGFS